MSSIEVVLVGAGRWGENIARTLKHLELERLVTLSYVVDVNLSRAIEVSNKYGFRSAVDSIDKTSGSAYIIATPINTLSKVAKKAMEVAHCVFIEKPAAENSREALELLSLAESRGLVHQVGYLSRFDSIIIELKRRVLWENVYGLRFRRLSGRPLYMRSYPITLDIMSHDIDLAFHLLNQREVKTLFSVFQVDEFGVPQRAIAGVTYGDIDVVFEADGVIPAKVREVDVLSEKEVVRADLVSRKLTIRAEASSRQIDVDGETPLRSELRAFVEKCSGRDVEVPDLEDAVAVLKLIEEISSAAVSIRETE
ncbi:MAG: Gfo/Idh/MocA family oxidoreductase [Sulfolobales archaeon]|nr:Gfo/Idh/MocA family oxidoreductase [Sulfolobales archaeon]MDW8082396.1 Gfo/Idh/MocA family oxidoreductase [Sulfolobales archaeon]